MPLLFALVALSSGYGELPVFPDLQPAISTCCGSHHLLGAPLLAAAPQFSDCWDAHGGTHEHTKVRLNALISDQGRALEVYAQGEVPELNACVVDVVFALEWAPPACTVGVVYPLHFSAAESD
jgi:hypothetical protein